MCYSSIDFSSSCSIGESRTHHDVFWVMVKACGGLPVSRTWTQGSGGQCMLMQDVSMLHYELDIMVSVSTPHDVEPGSLQLLARLSELTTK